MILKKKLFFLIYGFLGLKKDLLLFVVVFASYKKMGGFSIREKKAVKSKAIILKYSKASTV